VILPTRIRYFQIKMCLVSF